jgi:hypothetical protein
MARRWRAALQEIGLSISVNRLPGALAIAVGCTAFASLVRGAHPSVPTRRLRSSTLTSAATASASAARFPPNNTIPADA